MFSEYTELPSPIHTFISYQLSVLEELSESKYLRVTISDNLKWGMRIDNISDTFVNQINPLVFSKGIPSMPPKP